MTECVAKRSEAGEMVWWHAAMEMTRHTTVEVSTSAVGDNRTTVRWQPWAAQRGVRRCGRWRERPALRVEAQSAVAGGWYGAWRRNRQRGDRHSTWRNSRR